MALIKEWGVKKASEILKIYRMKLIDLQIYLNLRFYVKIDLNIFFKLVECIDNTGNYIDY